MEIKPIAYAHTDFKTKFGVPRQSGLAPSLEATIVFEPEYRMSEAFRGLEMYDYIWLLWNFSNVGESEWSPTCRPPRLGGNKRIGVFATRSPFRPNHIGLSSVRLLSVEETKENGTVLRVAGADLVDGTPIYDVKPYVTYADSHTEAKSGFVDETARKELEVEIPEDVIREFPKEKAEALREVLAADPRPSYQSDQDRIYGFVFSGYEIKFRADENRIVVMSIEKEAE